MKTQAKNFVLLTVSTLLSAVGIYFFKFANNFTFGGTSFNHRLDRTREKICHKDGILHDSSVLFPLGT